jgi:hypothetical protein
MKHLQKQSHLPESGVTDISNGQGSVRLEKPFVGVANLNGIEANI